MPDTDNPSRAATNSGTRNAVVATSTAIVTGVPSLLLSAFLAVLACAGGPVRSNSVRGTACDIPGLGPWPYVVGAAVVALLIVMRVAIRWRGSSIGLVLVAAAVPPGAMFTVVLLLHLLPRN